MVLAKEPELSEQTAVASGVSLRQMVMKRGDDMQHVVMVIGMLPTGWMASVGAPPWLNARSMHAGPIGIHLLATWAASTPTFTPTAGAPGSAAVQKLLDWGGWFALAASLGGLIIGAGMWAHSSTSGSYGGVHRGKQYVLGGAIGALVLGVAPLLISTLFATGKG